MNAFDDIHRGRRSFLKRTAAAGGALVTGSTLSILGAHAAWASSGKGRLGAGPLVQPYGPLVPAPDRNGDAILALPGGFRYVTFSKTGSLLLDGSQPVPRNHDGMGAFPGPKGTVRLIRNHELRNAPNNFALGVIGRPATRYDSKGMGGTVTVDFDPGRMRPVREFVSLNGTIVNCSGGLAFGDAGWITCEETTAGPNQGWDKKHGYNFFVPADSLGTVPAVPIVAMGRFSHEASVADPGTGIVYQTEDSGNESGFYRFVPNAPGNLMAGGRLQMLKVAGQPAFTGFTGQAVKKLLKCEWVHIANPDPNVEGGRPSCFRQGRAQGGAAFNRLEGIFRGEGSSIYFVSTSGGEARLGQLWQYRNASPGKGNLMLVFESPNGSVLDSPDNLCVTPRGSILFCEDDASGDKDTSELAPGVADVNRLIGLTRGGLPFTFAVNRLNDSEFAGACFSPDGNILFVNIFGSSTPGSGMTCAITGPWGRGPI